MKKIFKSSVLKSFPFGKGFRIGLLLIIFSVTLCKAQWVTIPDANFRNWLNAHGYASCMNGTLMDTTCSSIVNAASVDCNFQNISDLTGIQYFNSLTYLNCSYNLLDDPFPILSNSLQTLHCEGNLFHSIYYLPPFIHYLFCSSNNLQILPAPLPTQLIEIDMSHNNFNDLGSGGALGNFPTTLNYLDCSYNHIIGILSSLPIGLGYINCSYNQLTSLPFLPNDFYYLDCSHNQLTNLPTLPIWIGSPVNGGFYLNCSFNLLTNIPQLPNNFSNNLSTTYLDCSHNLLNTLPSLIDSVKYLNCSYNQLSNLPQLPNSIAEFIINNNPALSCIPSLNNFSGYSTDFNISNTGITCLPNVIQHTGYIAAIDTMPICSCVYPSGVTVSNITTNSIKVSWNTECCTEYRIQYKVTGTTTWTTKIAAPPLTYKTLISLTPGTTYDLKMKVKCTDGTTFSSWSPVQTFTTSVSCTAPTNLSVTNLSQTQATINWNTVTGAYSYKLVRRKLGTSAWTTSTILAPTTFKILTGLTNNTTYQYRLQTICNTSGTPSSSWTPINTFTTPLRMEDESNTVTVYFTIYPNPVSQLLAVTSEFSADDVIDIQDLLGRTVLSKPVGSEFLSNKILIDVTDLPSALYLVSIRRNDGRILVKQFVKE